jgi:hypothetical protein
MKALQAMTAIFELRPSSRYGIFAVPYRGGRPRHALRLPGGAIVEAPTADQLSGAPERPADCFEVAAGGGPANAHHANLGLIVGFLPLAGVYVLSSGEVAAIYGAEAVPLG